ncbi:methyltransferase domain-containing protein [Rosenbergiella australiborealis]|uniref:tRNA1(Val) (adenine(37)-N6)-methyltransferase n=1 Tax=Rosenbergiella australiborealis TaxID=1544696 RepID=A0ABS5T734_9GAMM|nr:methyltransferase [Rosenbergiella australiborealis]MBT0728165.1 methyltransferase domain-containing protein [Rosenbergiella australiborealis]
MTASITSPPRRGGFTFKQFFVGHDRCGMKVSTDGILLGAWAPLPTTRRILDIGTGSGLLALMLAQRLSPDDAPFKIDAIDIDPDAVSQAQENCDASPWCHNLTVWLQDFLSWEPGPENKYGLVICNPPYFQHGKSYRDAQREKARDSRVLDHQVLLQRVEKLLTDEGLFSLILPVKEAEHFIDYAQRSGWMLAQRCWIQEHEGMSAKRLLLTWCLGSRSVEESRLVIRNQQGDYSREFQSLTKEFYLGH